MREEIAMSIIQRESAAPSDQDPPREDQPDEKAPVAPTEPDPAEGADDTPPPNPGSPAG